MKIALPLLLLVLLSSCVLTVKEGDHPPTDIGQSGPSTSYGPPRIASKVAGMELRRGLFDVYLDRHTSEVWLELSDA